MTDTVPRQARRHGYNPLNCEGLPGISILTGLSQPVKATKFISHSSHHSNSYLEYYICFKSSMVLPVPTSRTALVGRKVVERPEATTSGTFYVTHHQ